MKLCRRRRIGRKKRAGAFNPRRADVTSTPLSLCRGFHGPVTVRRTGRVGLGGERLATESPQPEAPAPPRYNRTAGRPRSCRKEYDGKVLLRTQRLAEPPRSPKPQSNVLRTRLHSPFCKSNGVRWPLYLHGRPPTAMKQRLSLREMKTFPRRWPAVSQGSNGPKTAAKSTTPDGTARRLVGRSLRERLAA